MTIQDFFEGLKALVYTIVFPVGSFQWINHHRKDNNWRFVLLMLYGLGSFLLILRSIFSGYLAEQDPFWRTMLVVSIIAYAIGIIVFIILGHRKHREKYLVPQKNGAPETGQNVPL